MSGSPLMMPARLLMNLMMSLPCGRRGGLAGKDECARCHVQIWIFPQPVVQHDDAQRIEQLPLVFMDSLDLTIEDADRDPPPPVPRPSRSAHATWVHGWPCERHPEIPGPWCRALNSWSRSRSVTQPVPIASVIRSDRCGLANFMNQRRGVTPLVSLLIVRGRGRRTR